MDSVSTKKIMVVDDEEGFLFTMEYWLKSKGFVVKTATEGVSALDLVKSFNPDLILLDIHMPGVDGVETLRRIREFDKEVPVIIISAYVGEERLAEASAHHISGLFYKNRDLKEGLRLIESVLKT